MWRLEERLTLQFTDVSNLGCCLLIIVPATYQQKLEADHVPNERLSLVFLHNLTCLQSE